MKESRGFLYLFTGLAFGLGLGLFFAWGLAPTQFVDTTPASLRIDFKDEYRFMIASAYRANGDLIRAQARLNTIGDVNPPKALGEQAQRMLANNSSVQMVLVLADLSEALQTLPTVASTPSPGPVSPTPLPQLAVQPPGDEASSTPQNDTPTATSTALKNSPEPQHPPTGTDTPSPSPAPIATLAAHPRPSLTATPGLAFKLLLQTSQCEPSQPGLLQIYLSDTKSKPVAGVELVITWFGGEEHFFSGLKSEISPGYADYGLSENVEYDLSLSPAGTRVTGLRASTCTDASGGSYPGGIRLEFKQP